MSIVPRSLVDTTTSPYQEIQPNDEVTFSSLFPSIVKPHRNNGEASTSKRALSIGSSQTVETSDLTLRTVTSSCNLISESNDDVNDDFFEMSSNTSSDDEFRFVIEDSGIPVIETEPITGVPLTPISDEGVDDENCDISPPPARFDERIAVTADMTHIPPSNGNRSSIVKPYEFDSTLIKNSGWKNLPKLDCVSISIKNKKMNIIRKEEAEASAASRQQASSTVAAGAVPASTDTTVTTKKKKKKRSPTVVTFGYIAIRNYDQTIGDNPSVSYGTPISLDWTYEELGLLIRVDDYELGRSYRRTAHQMMLNYYQRRNILQYWYGHTVSEIDTAEKKANGLKFQRSITKMFLPYSFVEDAATSVVRKAKRRLNPTATTSPVTKTMSSSSVITESTVNRSTRSLTKSLSEGAITTVRSDLSVEQDNVRSTAVIARDSNDDTTTSSSTVNESLSLQQPPVVVVTNEVDEAQLIEC
jgi:hypothetical protein